MMKLWLVEAYCPMDHYNCMMPIEYEAVESGGVVQEYHKSKIACRYVKGEGCKHQEECVFFEKAPDILDKNTNWYDG